MAGLGTLAHPPMGAIGWLRRGRRGLLAARRRSAALQPLSRFDSAPTGCRAAARRLMGSKQPPSLPAAKQPADGPHGGSAKEPTRRGLKECRKSLKNVAWPWA